MKRFALGMALAAIWVGVLAGCSQKEEATVVTTPPEATAPPATPAVATALALGSVKVGDKAICVICAVGEGTRKPEEVKATLDYQGKTYAFCDEAEKAEFISSPAKYATAGK
jgi:YHS domain-containing protein